MLYSLHPVKEKEVNIVNNVEADMPSPRVPPSTITTRDRAKIVQDITVVHYVPNFTVQNVSVFSK